MRPTVCKPENPAAEGEAEAGRIQDPEAVHVSTIRIAMVIANTLVEKGIAGLC